MRYGGYCITDDYSNHDQSAANDAVFIYETYFELLNSNSSKTALSNLTGSSDWIFFSIFSGKHT